MKVTYIPACAFCKQLNAQEIEVYMRWISFGASFKGQA